MRSYGLKTKLTLTSFTINLTEYMKKIISIYIINSLECN